MAYDLVVAGGKIATRRGLRRREVAVRQGRIARVGTIAAKARRQASTVVDAAGCLVMPGAIDPHVHFDLTIGPGMKTVDDFKTGGRSAAAGGITTVIDYTTPEPGQRPREAFSARRRLADGLVPIDYSLHNVLIGWRAGWAEDLAWLVRQGAPSVKLFMIYKERGWQADDGMLFEVMEHCRRMGLTVCLHAENDSLISLFTRRMAESPKGADALADARPPLVEEEAVARAIRLAATSGARLHLVHLSTAEAARQVGRARRRGLLVSGETCPHYLALDRRRLKGNQGHRWGCCPPLRDRQNREGLLEALRSGALQALATDHCAFDTSHKDRWQGDFQKIPYGLPGVETSLAVTHTRGPAAGRLAVHRWVELHTGGPARLFGLWPRKGSLRRGADADLLIWDPQASYRLQAKKLQSVCDWNPYQNQRLQGRAARVFLRGVEIAREGRFLDAGMPGGFVRRQGSGQ